MTICVIYSGKDLEVKGGGDGMNIFPYLGLIFVFFLNFEVIFLHVPHESGI